MIYTFYSYKGGVGRSMAVANVGEWLYLRGLRVVLIDWDLEAPGLEAFFPTDGESVEMSARPGLMDLLLDYKEDLPYLTLPGGDLDLRDGGSASSAAEPSAGDSVTQEQIVATMIEQLPSIRSRLQPLHPVTDDGGALWLLPAGRRAGEALSAYAREVQRFDWLDFYQRYQGQAFFEWLRRSLLADGLADVVLIDSRTGISEMGGVSTRQLADVIVSLCVLNSQNIDGVATLTRTFLRDEVVKARGGRPIHAIVVPTRIETGEIDTRNALQKKFFDRVDDLTPDVMRSARRSFWDLRIPYVTKYAYLERLAVGAGDKAEELAEAYERLAQQLLAFEPEGTHARQILEPDPQAPESIAVPKLSNLPPRLPVVVGRHAVVDQMRSRLSETGAPLVLYGLGGVGKTTLAIEYAHRFQPGYELCWWIDARSSESIARGYAALGQALEEGLTLGPTAADVARKWLAGHAGWLVVLDGADDSESVMEQIPPTQAGHVVITSRSLEWGRLATTIEVPVLDRQASIELIVRRTGDVDQEAAMRLAEALGDLPLALEQASSYMDVTGRSSDLYLIALDEEGVALLGRGPQSSTSASVAETFESAYRKLLRDPRAQGLLAVCSMLAPSVPLELLSHVPDFAGSIALDEAILGLRRFSFATARGGELQIHPLLQRFVRTWLTDEDAERAAAGAITAVHATFDPLAPPGQGPLSPDRLFAHAVRALEEAEPLRVAQVEVVDVKTAVARYQSLHGELEAARETMLSALAYADRELPWRGPAMDKLLAAKAAIEFRDGDVAGARFTLDRRHRDAEKLEPPSRLASAASFGLVLGVSGELGAAGNVMGAALTEALSLGDPGTLSSLTILEAVMRHIRSPGSATVEVAGALPVGLLVGELRDSLLRACLDVLSADEVDAYIRRVRTRIVPGGPARAVAFSPAADTLATGMGAGSVVVWDAQGLWPRTVLDTGSVGVNSVAFSPHGSLLAAGADDGTVYVVRVGHDRLPGVGREQQHSGPVRHLAFSPSGSHLASVGDDGSLAIFEPMTREPIFTVTRPGLTAIAFSPEDDRLVVGDAKGCVEALAMPDGQSRAMTQGHSAEITDLAYSPDGQLVASASRDGTVRVYGEDAVTLALAEHDGPVNAVAFSPDSAYLASASDDRTVRVWSTRHREVVAVEEHPTAVRDVAFAPDGSLASAADSGFVRVWSPTLETLATLVADSYAGPAGSL